MMYKRAITLTTATVTAVAASLVFGGGTAFANSSVGTGTTNSIWNFFTGATSYYQNHSGDDIAMGLSAGVPVDSRWQKCSDANVVGQIQYNIMKEDLYHRMIGTNFAPGTCLKLQYRGFKATGSFTRETLWNYNME
ncbi:hypothetical protein ACFO1B_23710 [Dactylosporangium siamense]|nr:hypothetical protein [Dactylosporangium siamense]